MDIRHSRVLPNRRRHGAKVIWCGLLFVAMWSVGVAAAESPQQSPAGPAAEAVLDLWGGGFLAGEMVEMQNSRPGPLDVIVWKSPVFTEPFRFPIDCARGIRFPPAGPGDAPAAGNWWVELSNGDVLHGNLESFQDDVAIMTIGGKPAPIRLVLRREWIRHIRRDDSFTTYLGPSGLEGWQAKLASRWQEVGGGLTGEGRTSIHRSIPSGPRCRYDMAFSWNEAPVFQVTVAGGKRGPQYCLEFLKEGLIALRQEAGVGDGKVGRTSMKRLGDLPAGGLMVSAFVDQRAGRMVVRVPGMAETVCDMVIPPTSGDEVGDVFSVLIRSGVVRFESIRVTPWRTDEPDDEIDEEASVWLRDGGVILGQVTRFDGVEAVVAEVQGKADTPAVPRTVRREDVVGIVFPGTHRKPATADIDARGSVQVIDRWGSHLSSAAVSSRSGVLVLQHAAIEAPLELPLASLRTLICLDRRSEAPVLPGRIGLLECDAARSPGCFVAAPRADGEEAAAVLWQPEGSLTASPFAVFKEQSEPLARVSFITSDSKKPAQESAPLPPRPDEAARLRRGASRPTSRPPRRAEEASRIVLRTGESLGCLVESSSDQGVVVRVPSGGRITLSHDVIQAVELVETPAAQLSRDKFRSLTVLPRFQEHQPPTHLLRSLGGDYLRGWLVSLDEANVKMLVESGGRQVPARFPRDRVARVIWLHPQGDKAVERPPQPADRRGLPLRITSREGDSIGIWATTIEGDELRGDNPTIGPVHVPLEAIKQLEIGGVIGLVEPVEFSQWRLESAPGPRNLPPRTTPGLSDAAQ